ncbi:tripartite tricarboxylate transporter TctB family protein [Microbispora sp. KK1-11]|uniref:tripartite tricarboxylate transporter TctB family protein n=1 Tax=Microbispora sp. KK1-11 TaxID=2053005 RepID=UPI00115C43CF|nr:tripartite tricarboxylate transporter TctB family protein [Microbispora sp. KK1-11]TQS26116.1 tripartite tricarboxylate transporter TctB family protein [Microbispora sp. KK1-11]
MTRDAESGRDGVSGNVFHGPAPFQLGDRNVQINHIHHPAPPRRPLVLAGAAVTTREELAAAIRRDWSAARRRFFEGAATTGAPSDGWLGLLTWLHELDGLTADDLTAQIELIDHRLRDDALPADLKLLHLLGWLDPEGEAVWRGTVVTPESLSEALRIGRLRESGPEWELYRDLCEGGLLDALSRFTVLSALRGTQRVWDDVWDSWRQLAAEVPGLPPEAREWAESGARGLLLAALLPYSESRTWLRAGCESVEPPPTGEIAWYDWLRARDGGPDTPVGWLVRADFTAFAAAQAEQQRRQAAIDRQNQRMVTVLDSASALRDRQWADYESGRLSPAARLGAVIRAALWLGAWGAATIPLAWIIWGWARPDIAATLSWYLVALTLAAYAGRLPGVIRLGAAYQPPLRRVREWAEEARADRGSVRRGVIRAAAVVGFLLIFGVLIHDVDFIVTTVLFTPLLAVAFYFARIGALHDWADEHQERLRDYQSRRPGSGGIPQSIAQGVRSPSPRVRAEAYQAWVRQFTGLDHGGKGDADR